MNNSLNQQLTIFGIIGSIIVIIMILAIFGMISWSISKGRGMKGGFWWGFFLNIIGIIVVAVRPNDNKVGSAQKRAFSSYEDLERLARLREQGVLTEDEYLRMKKDCMSRIK